MPLPLLFFAFDFVFRNGNDALREIRQSLHRRVVIMEARALHRLVAGRETRPSETWQLLGQWIIDGCGLLVAAYKGDEMVGYVYCTIHGNHAYYFSSACQVKNLNHALLWHAMTALKARGVRWFELGWQSEAHDAKGKQIEFFKTGFGGYDIPAKEAPALCER